eukprot:71598-Hanusia_phi.AAC.1
MSAGALIGGISSSVCIATCKLSSQPPALAPALLLLYLHGKFVHNRLLGLFPETPVNNPSLALPSAASLPPCCSCIQLLVSLVYQFLLFLYLLPRNPRPLIPPPPLPPFPASAPTPAPPAALRSPSLSLHLGRISLRKLSGRFCQ